MSDQSMVLDFAFGTNALINEGAKNALEVAIESDMLKNSLATKIPGIKFGIVGKICKTQEVFVSG